MEKIAISGSSGFIGQHLLARFKEAYRLDRSGILPEKFDVVYDLAAFGNMAGHGGDHQETYKANLNRIVTMANYLGDAKLVFVSTSSVNLPVQTAYSLSKKAAEDYIQTFIPNSVIVRPYTVIGVGEPKEHLIPKLIDSCFNGTEMPFVGEPVHDFLHVEDFVDALLLIAKKSKLGGVYEVGSGTQYSNKFIRGIVEYLTDKNANVKMVESMRAYDSLDWKSKNERVSELGWQPKRGVAQAIEEMILEYKNGKRS